MPGQAPEFFHIRLANRLEEVETFTGAAHAFLLGLGVSEKTVFNVDFCFEEAFTNILKYSFPDDGEHWIDVRAEVKQDSIVLHIEDDGAPFDPKDAAVPDLNLPVEDRPIGGLGVYLIKAIASGLEYEHVDERNRLTIFLRRDKE